MRSLTGAKALLTDINLGATDVNKLVGLPVLILNHPYSTLLANPFFMTVNHTILCVDDDQDDLHLLQKAIRTIDPLYTIEEAYNGVEAIDLLSKMKARGTLPALIVLDINMPKMDGRETFLSIKNDEALSDIPVVILSTSSSVLDRIFFHKKNVEYITKPIHFDTLLSIAEKLLSLIKPAG